MTANMILIIIASGLSGYTIGEISRALGIPSFIGIAIAATFGWFLAGIIVP